jgi:cell division transport system ATP-binding protein
MIQLVDVGYRYGSHPIFSHVNMHVATGEFVFLIGVSGAGKSTLLRMLTMDLMPQQGRVTVANFNSATIKPGEIPFLRRKIGVIYQDFKLLTDRDVYDNVAFALFATGVPRRRIKKRVFQVLAEVGLSHKRYASVLELSGGEKQRVAIARALANEPFVLLADEPTGNLDPESTEDIMKLLFRINRRGTAVLMATHKALLSDLGPSRVRRIENGKVI